MEARAEIKGAVPVGALADLLQRYDAPVNVTGVIARRAGGVVGTTLPIARIEEAITASMSETGLPNWDRVKQSVGGMVTDVYRGLKRT